MAVPAGGGVTRPGNCLFKRRALAETTIGLYKTECIREDSPFRNGPLETLADVSHITSGWVYSYNTSRLMRRRGRKPPAEAEGEYYDHRRSEHPCQAHT